VKAHSNHKATTIFLNSIDEMREETLAPQRWQKIEAQMEVQSEYPQQSSIIILTPTDGIGKIYS